MRYRATFIAGFAVGFIAGARAGRERYEQIVKASRKVAENPAVQKATRAAGAKAAERMPRVTETAKSSATKVRGQFDRLPGRHSAQTGADTGAESEAAAVNGTRPAD
jgi:hypothetical protein